METDAHDWNSSALSNGQHWVGSSRLKTEMEPVSETSRFLLNKDDVKVLIVNNKVSSSISNGSVNSLFVNRASAELPGVKLVTRNLIRLHCFIFMWYWWTFALSSPRFILSQWSKVKLRKKERKKVYLLRVFRLFVFCVTRNYEIFFRRGPQYHKGWETLN